MKLIFFFLGGIYFDKESVNAKQLWYVYKEGNKIAFENCKYPNYWLGGDATWAVESNGKKIWWGMNYKDMSENPNHSIALQSFPTQKNRPNLLIRPKIFMISFKIATTTEKKHQSLHSLKMAMEMSCDEAKNDLLREYTPQVVQLRKEPEKSVYHLIIENISSRKAKEILIRGIQRIYLSQPIATSEVVNSQWNRAKLFETSDWETVRTVLFQSREKDKLMVLQEGGDLETQVYDPETEMIKMTIWPVFPNNNKLKNEAWVKS